MGLIYKVHDDMDDVMHHYMENALELFQYCQEHEARQVEDMVKSHKRIIGVMIQMAEL